jgi:parallel beta-helix repeat protein
MRLPQSTITLFLAIAACTLVPATNAADTSPAITVTSNTNSPTSGIQEAIDTLGGKPGIINIPAGTYLLRRSIRVHSGLTLQGAGEGTILTRPKQTGSKLAAPATTEDRSLKLESTAGLSPGDEIGIFDQTTVGWLHAHAIIKSIDGNTIHLDRRVGRAFDPAQGAAVINYFTAIFGSKISNVALKGMMIDGGGSAANPGPSAVSLRKQRTPPDLGFNFAAINLLEMESGRIENVHISGWPADGISVQKGVKNSITNCLVENCRGPGFHAGGRETDSVFANNIGRTNLGDGFYFCAWVTRVTVKDNQFIRNEHNGIGGLGDSEDVENVVENNMCEFNGRNGILLWDGTSNTVKNNTCQNNSQSAPGQYSGISILATTSSLISGNRCFDDQPTKTQKHGIEENPNSSGNKITNNDCRNNAQAGISLKGKDSQQSGNHK